MSFGANVSGAKVTEPLKTFESDYQVFGLENVERDPFIF